MFLAQQAKAAKLASAQDRARCLYPRPPEIRIVPLEGS